MSTPEDAATKPVRKAGIPRWAVFALAPLVWLVAIPVVHGVVPWAISLLGPWYGWADGSPAVWNLIGLVPVAAGAVVLCTAAPSYSSGSYSCAWLWACSRHGRSELWRRSLATPTVSTRAVSRAGSVYPGAEPGAARRDRAGYRPNSFMPPST
jgi:hypothetical protein